MCTHSLGHRLDRQPVRLNHARTHELTTGRLALGRGEQRAGDLIPWTVSQQFQESRFAQLSGARIVRIASHPDALGMGPWGGRVRDTRAVVWTKWSSGLSRCQ